MLVVTLDSAATKSDDWHHRNGAYVGDPENWIDDVEAAVRHMPLTPAARINGALAAAGQA
jgi:hypothetical protein